MNKLEALFGEDDSDVIEEEKEIAYESYSPEDFLNEVFMDNEHYTILVDLLRNKKTLFCKVPLRCRQNFYCQEVGLFNDGPKRR